MKSQVTELRQALLHLHKTLVESERIGYEAAVGAIATPNHFLHLLTTDPWFAWLHPLSELIVTFDEALDEKEPLTPAIGEALMEQSRKLLVVSETGEGFPRHYFEALQRDPDVVLAHAETTKLMTQKKTPPLKEPT